MAEKNENYFIIINKGKENLLWIVTLEFYIETINSLPVLFPRQVACLPKYLLVACLSGFLRGQEIVHLQYLISTNTATH